MNDDETKEMIKQYHKYIKSKDFDVIRDKVFARDNFRCVCCNATANERVLQAHHKTYDHLYDELNHLEDLSTLCKVCHNAIHKAKSNLRRFSFKKQNKINSILWKR